MSRLRPDIGRRVLLVLPAVLLVALLIVTVLARSLRPGDPAAQLAAIAGALLLLAPLLFLVLKRSGLAASPPTWFVVHVIASIAGAILVLVHVAGGSWFSPPGLVLLAMLVLIVHGALARALSAEHISGVFGGAVANFGITQRAAIDRDALQRLIDQKSALLRTLDPAASEALFSPTLVHWLRSPRQSWRYQRLAGAEQHMLGGRQRAGLALSWWRRVHLLAAAVFYVGLVLHVVVVTFFAGYVAGDGDIYWWHLTDWGR